MFDFMAKVYFFLLTFTDNATPSHTLAHSHRENDIEKEKEKDR